MCLLSLILVITLQSFVSLNAHATVCTNSRVLSAGLSNAECLVLEDQLAIFRKRAHEKSQRSGILLRNLEPHQVIRDLKDNNMQLVGFAGRSVDFDLSNPADVKEMQAVRRVTNGILSGLDPYKHIIVHGGTASGFGDLLALRAVEMGFLVMGLTAAAAAKYEPALMHFLLATMDSKFGGESSVLVALADALFVVGSGAQGAREAVDFSYKDPKNLFMVADSAVGGSSFKMSSEVSEIPFYRSGFDAVRAFTGAKSANLSNLTGNIERYKDLSSVRDVYGNHSKIIGVAGFVTGNFDIAQVATISNEVLSQLRPQNTIVAISGTQGGPEEIFAEIALSLGFPVVALTSEEMDPKRFMKGLKEALSVAHTWANYTRNFVSNLDAMISFSGRKTINDQLTMAKGRIPFLYIENPNFTALNYLVKTQFLKDSKGTGFSVAMDSKNRAEQIATAIQEMIGVPRCVLTFGKHSL